jgi:hypothetical protein
VLKVIVPAAMAVRSISVPPAVKAKELFWFPVLLIKYKESEVSPVIEPTPLLYKKPVPLVNPEGGGVPSL